jgi:hypothetical protein
VSKVKVMEDDNKRRLKMVKREEEKQQGIS